MFCSPCMHVLRSTYLPSSCPSYSSFIRHPYTSDPSHSPRHRLMMHARRSTGAVKRSFWICLSRSRCTTTSADESELRLGQPEPFRDLFDLMQPRALLEDLLCAYLAPSRLDLTAYSVTFAPMRRALASDDRRCRTSERRKAGGGGQESVQKAQGAFGRDAMTFLRLFSGMTLLLYSYYCTCMLNLRTAQLTSVSDECFRVLVT